MRLRRMVSMRAATLGLVAALVLAACAPAAEESTSRLAIVDDGQVVVVYADGSARVPITEGIGEFYFQPIWSPDGTRLAFSRIGSSPSIFLANPDGTATYSSPLETFPFYFYWSAQNDLAFLRNGASGLTLDVTSIEVEALAAPRQIESGQPLYFSWSPEGETMVTHVGPDRLDLNDTESSTPLGPQPGAFQSPSWTTDGIVAIEQGARDQKLIIVRDGDATPIATVLGPATFVATRDGSRVAVQALFDGTNGITAAYQSIPVLPSNRVVVVDAEDGSSINASEGPALAYFWSPDGEQLLILDIVPGPAARWSVWSDEGTVEMNRFEPDPGFLRDMVPFFDQYAQSMSLWAPDGSAFAFPGTVDGESGIWVQDMGGELERVSSGTWVSWSP